MEHTAKGTRVGIIITHEAHSEQTQLCEYLGFVEYTVQKMLSW